MLMAAKGRYSASEYCECAVELTAEGKRDIA
jgi:hypothetical protein